MIAWCRARGILIQDGLFALTLVFQALGVRVDSPRRDAYGLTAIDDLVAQVRSAGQPVEFIQHGIRRPDIPDGVALAVYRVVQEALTNAIKHAPGRHTVVHLDYAEDDITVQVVNDARPPSLPPTPPRP
jgi:glucose-6-phosphate-specific signal transduction histidine kinase